MNVVSKKYPNPVNESNTGKTFKCYECGLEFEEKSEFLVHWLEHVKSKVEKTSKKKKETGPFKCKICKTKFSKKWTLKKHLRKGCHPSTGVPNEPPKARSHSKLFSCSFCDYSTSRRGRLTIHLVVHSDLRPFKCDLCTATFKRSWNVNEHKRLSHLNERPHKCDECPSAFQKSSALNYHKSSIHSDLRPFKCNLCDSSFKLKGHLDRHLQGHSSFRPYSCELCDYAAKQKDDLKKHKRDIHNIE